MPRQTRRVITGHDAHGKAIVVADESAPNVKVRTVGNLTSTLVWVTDESPANIESSLDPSLRETGVAPPPGGSIHRTRSIDYAIVLEGEIDMLLDDSEVHLKAGDVLIQKATNHAWVNRSHTSCRIAFVLIDAIEPEAWKAQDA